MENVSNKNSINSLNFWEVLRVAPNQRILSMFNLFFTTSCSWLYIWIVMPFYCFQYGFTIRQSLKNHTKIKRLLLTLWRYTFSLSLVWCFSLLGWYSFPFFSNTVLNHSWHFIDAKLPLEDITKNKSYRPPSRSSKNILGHVSESGMSLREGNFSVAFSSTCWHILLCLCVLVCIPCGLNKRCSVLYQGLPSSNSGLTAYRALVVTVDTTTSCIHDNNIAP